MTKQIIFAIAIGVAMLCADHVIAADNSGPASYATGRHSGQSIDTATSHTLHGRRFGGEPLMETPKPDLLYISDWNRIPEDIKRSPDEQTLKIPTKYKGKKVTLEQRRYPLKFASPKIIEKSFKKVITKHLAKIRYDRDTAEIIVIDLPAIHERLWRYLQAMDTPKPARMSTAPADKIEEIRKKLTEALSPEGELTPFEDEGVLIVRDTEKNIAKLEKAILSATKMPATAPHLIKKHVKSRFNAATMSARETTSQPSQKAGQ